MDVVPWRTNRPSRAKPGTGRPGVSKNVTSRAAVWMSSDECVELIEAWQKYMGLFFYHSGNADSTMGPLLDLDSRCPLKIPFGDATRLSIILSSGV